MPFLLFLRSVYLLDFQARTRLLQMSLERIINGVAPSEERLRVRP